jgi:hypothetical protein
MCTAGFIMAASESEATALRRAFVEVGIDPTGIDLAWLAEVKAETERQISAATRCRLFRREA